MATKIRYYPPGSIHMITRRTTQREFWFRPDPEIVQNTLYLLGYQQARHRVELHATNFLSNHNHLAMTDVLGDTIPEFTRDFYSLLARTTNCYRGRWENLWSSEQVNSVEIAPLAEDVIDKLAYIITNAVTAGLVSHAKKWPGVRILAKDLGGLTLRVKRPGFFYNPNGKMPGEATVKFTLPKVKDMEPCELGLRVAQECNRREQEVRDRFQREGRKFNGAKRILRQSPRSKPHTVEPRRKLTPHVACKNPELRRRYLKWRQARQRRYERLRQALLRGVKDVIFPEGTWALHRLFGFKREPWQGCRWDLLAAEP